MKALLYPTDGTLITTSRSWTNRSSATLLHPLDWDWLALR